MQSIPTSSLCELDYQEPTFNHANISSKSKPSSLKVDNTSERKTKKSYDDGGMSTPVLMMTMNSMMNSLF